MIVANEVNNLLIHHVFVKVMYTEASSNKLYIRFGCSSCNTLQFKFLSYNLLQTRFTYLSICKSSKTSKFSVINNKLTEAIQKLVKLSSD